MPMHALLWMCMHALSSHMHAGVYVFAVTASILNSSRGDCASLGVMNIRESIHLHGMQFHR